MTATEQDIAQSAAVRLGIIEPEPTDIIGAPVIVMDGTIYRFDELPRGAGQCYALCRNASVYNLLFGLGLAYRRYAAGHTDVVGLPVYCYKLGDTNPTQPDIPVVVLKPSPDGWQIVAAYGDRAQIIHMLETTPSPPPMPDYEPFPVQRGWID